MSGNYVRELANADRYLYKMSRCYGLHFQYRLNDLKGCLVFSYPSWFGTLSGIREVREKRFNVAIDPKKGSRVRK